MPSIVDFFPKPPPPPGPVETPPPPPIPAAAPEGFWVDSGNLNAWLVGLETKAFISNEKAARDFGVLEVVNNFTIPEMKAKLAQGSGRIFFEKKGA